MKTTHMYADTCNYLLDVTGSLLEGLILGAREVLDDPEYC